MPRKQFEGFAIKFKSGIPPASLAAAKLIRGSRETVIAFPGTNDMGNAEYQKLTLQMKRQGRVSNNSEAVASIDAPPKPMLSLSPDMKKRLGLVSVKKAGL